MMRNNDLKPKMINLFLNFQSLQLRYDIKIFNKDYCIMNYEL